MKKHRFGIFSLVAVAALMLSQSVRADSHPDVDPEELARRCVHSVTELAERCAEHNAETARRCIRRIRALLDAGQREEAVHLARRCIRHINQHSDECVDEIHHRCRRCIEALLELGEPELARRVHEACERAVHVVRRSQRRAVHAIRSQFGDGQEDV